MIARILSAFAVAMLLAMPVFAQEAKVATPHDSPPAQPAGGAADPRTASQAIEALKAMLVLREAEFKALREDAMKQIAEGQAADEAHQKTWAEWWQKDHSAPSTPK